MREAVARRTPRASALARARRERHERERMERRQAALAAILLAFALIVSGLAGTLDYQDRLEALGAPEAAELAG